jgi:hypothetical protein
MKDDRVPAVKPARVPWSKDKLVGAKPPLRPSHVWLIRTKLKIERKKAISVTLSRVDVFIRRNPLRT